MFVKSVNYWTENKATFVLPNGEKISMFITPEQYKGREYVCLAIDADRSIKFEFQENIRDFRNKESNNVTEKNYNM